MATPLIDRIAARRPEPEPAPAPRKAVPTWIARKNAGLLPVQVSRGGQDVAL